MNATVIKDESRVLIVDDWMETAAQMTAATALIEQAGGVIAGLAVLDAEVNKQSRALTDTYRLHTVNRETDI